MGKDRGIPLRSEATGQALSFSYAPQRDAAVFQGSVGYPGLYFPFLGVWGAWGEKKPIEKWGPAAVSGFFFPFRSFFSRDSLALNGYPVERKAGEGKKEGSRPVIGPPFSWACFLSFPMGRRAPSKDRGKGKEKAPKEKVMGACQRFPGE